MFAVVSERITRRLEESRSIQSEERELYLFGIEQGLTMLLNLATTLCIGLLCGMVWQSVVFTATYIPLRSFAGGYHAKTPTRCYIFSVLLMIATLLAMRWVYWTPLMCIILLSLSGVLIWLLAPVEDRNKPLDIMERQVYRKRSRRIGTFELALALVCVTVQWQQLAVCLTSTGTVMSVMLILGKLKNVQRRNDA